MTAPTRPPRTTGQARRPAGAGGAAAAAAAAPAARPAPRGKRPSLAVVDRRSVRSVRLRRTLLAAVLLVLVVALFAVGLVQAQLVQRQQHLDDVRSQIAEAQAHRLRLAQEVVVASSPEEIVRRAGEMGMVRAESPVYLVAVRPVVAG